ncbi:MAG: hypothetical protein GX252_02975 [Enterococcus cecorum]|nr:hypothetical protein [Clostridiaceae bacterium]NLL32276.1 hypothetical protein [Enterococcus cecorum]
MDNSIIFTSSLQIGEIFLFSPTELSWVSSALTNTIHQIGGPLGLAIIVLNASQFKTEMMLIACYTAVAIVIIVFGMLKKE